MVILEPYHSKRNQLLEEGAGRGDSSGKSDRNTQKNSPALQQSVLSSDGFIPRDQYATLMLEVESMRAQLAQRGADQHHDDEPPDYYSRAGSADTRPPDQRFTDGKARNSS